MPDLAQPGAGGRDQVGQPETGADLDQLAAADDHLAAGGQRRGGQHQSRRAVVDDQRVLGRRARGEHRSPGASTPALGPGAGGQVELDVDVPARGDQRRHRGLATAARGRDWCAPRRPVAFSTGRRPIRPRAASSVTTVDATLVRTRDRRGGRVPARRGRSRGRRPVPSRAARLAHLGQREQLVGARDPATGVRDGRAPSTRHVTRCGGSGWRRRTGIEPARPRYSTSSVLKTAGTTRNPHASLPNST